MMAKVIPLRRKETTVDSNEWKLVDRFKEPSSWAALAAGLGTIGLSLPGGLVQAISLVGAGVCCAFGFFMKEGH